MISKRPFLQWQPLFLISALGLFFELAVIRWLSGEVRLFSYFKNLPLLAAFLGLAVGFALVGKSHDHRARFAPRFALFVVVVLAFGRIASPRGLAYPGSGDEFLWFTAPLSYWLALVLFLSVVTAFFFLTMFLFIPLGQATGEEMARHAPVSAYIVNLLGSLAGIWAFSLLSYLQVPAVVWFGLGLVGLGLYLAIRRMLSHTTAVIFVLVLVVLAAFGRGEIWSPYQRLEVTDALANRKSDGKPIKVGYKLSVQHVFYQYALDLSPEFLVEVPVLEDCAFSYNLPYRLGPRGERVLVLGAGMGNDVAAALRNGAGRIDAVEIDPAILALGRSLHPEKPYDDPRVTTIVDDARSFYKKSSDQYDVIAFGLLDSHTLLSGLSSVRLDSFVYTIESFEQAREHLAENGLMVVTFSVGTPWIEERLGRMMVEVFGSDKVSVHRGALGTTFVAGTVSPDKMAKAQLTVWQPDPTTEDLPLSTDDWPYLYLRARKVPAAYWQALLLIGVLFLAVMARSFPDALHPNWHFWLLGAAFLLIEFKSVTELALLFGTTWLVNALAISGVLLMALGANLVVMWRPRINLWLAYTLLFASLALAYVFPLDWLSGFAPVARAMGSMILLSLPLFFAGLIFGESLRLAGETAGPFASNLSGSAAGGILEYGSLWWGIKNLYMVAAVVYAGALLTSLVQRKH